MANQGTYTIRIAAIDGATSVINTINKRLAAYRGPVDRLSRSLSKFGKLSGVSQITSGIRALGGEARNAAGFVGGLLEPLGIITGAATVAGIIKSVEAFAQWGVAISNTSMLLGVGVNSLANFEGAARLAGLSAGAADGMMRSLGDTMQDAVAGRNAQAMRGFQLLGINIRKSGYEARNADEIMEQFADRIAHMGGSAATKRHFLQGMGVDPNMLPLLERYNELMARARRFNAVNPEGVRAAKSLYEAFTDVKLAAEGVGYSIASSLAPVLGPMLEQLASFIAAHRDDIAGFFRRIAESIQAWVAGGGIQRVAETLGNLGTTISTVVGYIGGWQTVAYAVAAVMAGPLVSSILGVSGALLTLVANPVGLVIAGLAALGVAAYELYQHWDAVKAMFGNLWQAVKDLFTNNTGYIRTVVEALFPLPSLLVNRWDVVKPFFTEMWKAITSAFDEGWSYVSAVFDRIKGAVNWIANSTLGKKLGWVASEVGGAASTAGSAIVNAAAGIPGIVDNATGYTPGAQAAGAAQRGQGGAFGAANSPGTPITAPEKSDRETQAMKYFMSQGWTKAQAAGITGNIMQESGFRNDAVGDGGHAYGIGQWHEDRAAKIQEHFHKRLQDMSYQEQLAAYDWELKNTEKHAGDMLRQQITAAGAAAAVSKYGERPADQLGEMQRRAQLGQQIEARYQGAGPSAQQPQSAQQASPDATQSGKVTVEISHKDVPQGVRLTAKTEGRNVATNVTSSPLPYSGI